MKQTINQKILAALKDGGLPKAEIAKAIGLPSKRAGAPLWVLKDKGVIELTDDGLYKLTGVNTTVATTTAPKQDIQAKRDRKELAELKDRCSYLNSLLKRRDEELIDALAIIRYLEEKFIKAVRMVRA
jgi:DNA-binding IclR family transcriptional regulator